MPCTTAALYPALLGIGVNGQESTFRKLYFHLMEQIGIPEDEAAAEFSNVLSTVRQLKEGFAGRLGPR